LRCARRIFDAETISIARVIWVMFLTERMRRRISRVLGTINSSFKFRVPSERFEF
jgi:hypothetical protein